MATETQEKAVNGLQEIESVSEETRKEMVGHADSSEVVLVTSGHAVRKIPIPTDNPNDPLNWPRWMKMAVMVTCCWFSIFSVLSVSGLGAIMNTLFQMYASEHSPTVVAGMGSYPSLVMAFGSLVLLPLAIVFGRRPVFILSVLIVMAASTGGGASNTFEGQYAARIFQGLGTGVTESLLPLIISDITFINERGRYFGIYWAIQSGVGAALNISLSYIVAASSWRWYYWLFAITLGFGTLLVIFFSPETKFARSPMALNGVVVHTDEFGVTHVISDQEARDRFGHVQEHTTDTKDPQMQSYWSTIKPDDPNVKSQNAFKVWLKVYVQIAQACTSPAVIFATLASSISLGIGIGGSVIYSTVLIQNFNWSAASVGLFNAGVIPASFIAMFYAGFICDKLNIWLAARNKGIHTPEHHLIHLIFPCIVGAIGIVAIAVPAQWPENHSVWGMIIGWALFQFSFISIIITTTAFAAEALQHNPGPAIVVVVGGKNVISFAAAYGLIPMAQKYSYITSFMILLGIYLAIFALGIPVYFLNSKWRSFFGRKKPIPL